MPAIDNRAPKYANLDQPLQRVPEGLCWYIKSVERLTADEDGNYVTHLVVVDDDGVEQDHYASKYWKLRGSVAEGDYLAKGWYPKPNGKFGYDGELY